MTGLDWPPEFERTAPEDRESSRFDVTETRAWKHIQRQVNRLDGSDLVIETAKPQRKRDNMPFARAREPEDPGAIVRWRMNGQDYCVACDRWTKVRCNLRAIGKTIEAMRGIDRWGAVTTEQAFEGLEALPPGDGSQTHVASLPAHEVLGVAEDASVGVIKAAFKARAVETHPDKGGSSEAFGRVSKAKEEMLAERGEA